MPFNVRNGIHMNVVTNDFPKETRNALYIILTRFVDKCCISGGWYNLCKELYRTCRYELNYTEQQEYEPIFKEGLYKASWNKVFMFIERVYDVYLDEVLLYDRNGDPYDCAYTKDEVKEEFSKEINTLLLEDNIAFEFQNGEFYRRGRAITQKSIMRVGTVLGDNRLQKVKKHFLKALEFFRSKDKPDYENTIKEAICALELTFDVLSGKKISKDFASMVKQFEGNSEKQIPSPIIQSMIKIYGYRNSGEGVSHGIDKGLRVTELEAELILNIAATNITYLYDFFTGLEQEEELPF